MDGPSGSRTIGLGANLQKILGNGQKILDG